MEYLKDLLYGINRELNFGYVINEDFTEYDFIFLMENKEEGHFYVNTKDNSVESLIESINSAYDKLCKGPEKEIVNRLKEFVNQFYKYVVEENSMHVCKYCGALANGEYADLLCDHCIEMFGHRLYSEL